MNPSEQKPSQQSQGGGQGGQQGGGGQQKPGQQGGQQGPGQGGQQQGGGGQQKPGQQSQQPGQRRPTGRPAEAWPALVLFHQNPSPRLRAGDFFARTRRRCLQATQAVFRFDLGSRFSFPPLRVPRRQSTRVEMRRARPCGRAPIVASVDGEWRGCIIAPCCSGFVRSFRGTACSLRREAPLSRGWTSRVPPFRRFERTRSPHWPAGEPWTLIECSSRSLRSCRVRA